VGVDGYKGDEETIVHVSSSTLECEYLSFARLFYSAAALII
jgi:hypothetical protein